MNYILRFRDIIISLPFILLTNISYGQSTLNGQLLDELQTPIEYADILNTTANTHTHTDKNGRFKLTNTSIGDTIKCIFLGYDTEQIIVTTLEDQLEIILSEKTISLDEIVIAPRINALKIISDIDIMTNPVNSAQDVLTQVPGLFIGQHAGGGKAEQIFLRGFDIDHGTDIAISVDGLPGNMVSHAHGQGYTDMHFIIPETIDNIDFGKGPYYANKGNFNTAGYVDFATKKNLGTSTLKIETGQFNWQRILSMMDLINTKKSNAYIAAEHISSDGPFESPQNFKRTNVFSKFSSQLNSTDRLEVSFSHFTSSWDASGQIPQRAIDSGQITRFGAIDDTEGGYTSRTNLNFKLTNVLNDHSFVESQAYYSLYDFELYSNFTFFLEDPINGDQIKQKESRETIGLQTEYNHAFYSDKLEGLFQFGLQLRNDQSTDNELSRTLNRKEVLEFIQLGDVNETNIASYVNTELIFGKWLINPAIRADIFEFQYYDQLATTYDTKKDRAVILSPKLNVLYNYSNNLQFYVKTGKGFHSNDTRTILNQSVQSSLPGALGFDLGFIWKPIPRLFVNAAYWYLFLEQEFVYVGDAGIVEASGKTRRQGIDFSLRYQLADWLFLDTDANYALARSIEEVEGQNYIPLAPDFTFTSGLKMIHDNGITAGIHLRHIKDRPANEDYTITAEGYTVVDLNTSYQWKRIQFGIQVQNVFDTEWNETQFATESRLFNETEAVEEIHLTPGTPFFLKGVFSLVF